MYVCVCITVILVVSSITFESNFITILSDLERTARISFCCSQNKNSTDDKDI